MNRFDFIKQLLIGKNNIRTIRINIKFQLMLITQAIILFALFAALLNAYSENTRQQQDNSIYQLNHTILANTRHMMNILNTTSLFPVIRSPTRFEDKLFQFLIKPEKIEQAPAEFSRIFEIRASEITMEFPSVESVFLFSVEGDILAYKTTDLVYRPVRSCNEASWRQTLLDKKGALQLLKPYELAEIQYIANSQTLYGGRLISDPLALKPLCLVVIGSKLADITTDFESQKLFVGQNFMIADHNGSAVFGSRHFDEVIMPHNTSSNQVVYQTDDAGVRFAYHISYDSGLNIFSIIETPARELLRPFHWSNWYFHILFALVICSNLLIFGLVFKGITKPLNKLMAACASIGDGDFTIRIDSDSKDELGYLTQAFNKMSAQVEQLINEVYLKDLTERDLELQMLRSQINPHFLYNTLESMRMSAYAHGFPDLAQMCYLLAGALRYGVSMPNQLVTVQEELSKLEDYIQLLKYRFDNNIIVRQHVHHDLLSYKIIKLLLQPIVENCINHGMMGSGQALHIEIWGYIQGNNVIFTVSDNGVGMNRETLEALMGYINNQNEYFKSIGIKNIHRRIKLFYGEEYGVYVESEPGHGASVTIRLPYGREEENENV